MEPIYQLLIQLFETASINPLLFLQDSIQLLPGPTLPLDHVTELCFKHSFSFDSGNSFKPSDDLIESPKTCPSNNSSVERVFGQFYAELKRATHCTLSAVYSKLLYKNNKTADG